ncbi:MAG: hypothetical protein FWE32_01425 [Oscillospiraceae bacterium]|nr:hypothetical protein [Oscillospiraceae bacterium]
MDENRFGQEPPAEEQPADTYVIEGLVVGVLLGVVMMFTLFENPLPAIGFGVAMGWIIGSRIEKKKKK